MINKIYIPTVNRVNQQITYDNLPKSLQKRVVMVVQSWERDQYDYDCEYLVLPEEFNLSDYHCLAKTRKFIYETAGTDKYCILDDDIKFIMRNKKYWSDEGDQWRMNPKTGEPVTKEACKDEDILDMFNLYDKWLDEVSFCGGVMAGSPPPNVEFKEDRPIFSQLFVNGADLHHRLNEFDLTSVRYDEDCYFLLQLLSKGFKIRESSRYNVFNLSCNGKVKDTLWANTTKEEVRRCYSIIEKKFPAFYQLKDKHGKIITTNAFRGFVGKSVQWKKAYKSSLVA